MSDTRSLFRLLNAEGPYTLLAPDLEIAAVTAIVLGRGHYGLEEVGGGRRMPQFVTDGADAWFTEHLGDGASRTLDRVLHERSPALVTCLGSVLAGTPEERHQFDTQLNALTDPNEREAYREQWRDSHRQAAHDLGTRAVVIAARLQRNHLTDPMEMPDE